MRSTLGQANEKEDEIDFHAANNCVSPSNTIRTGGDLVAIPFEPRLLDQQLPGGQKRHRQHHFAGRRLRVEIIATGGNMRLGDIKNVMAEGIYKINVAVKI